MTALEYHDVTKHHFNRFARSAGYLDWTNQPEPFRRYAGAPVVSLSRDAVATPVEYDAIFDGSLPPSAMTPATVSELLRGSMGLSAWKQYQASRWALRVNPSSGNLHPTETYIVWNDRVSHYAPREHAIEERCVFGRAGGQEGVEWGQRLLVGLSSVFWREAWKYGERAFRYCQHDLGHAIAAVRLSAARLGWQVRMLTEWTDPEIATLLGLDRIDDFTDAERETAECLLLVTAAEPLNTTEREPLLERARQGTWSGRANRLSADHVSWSAIEEVAAATEYRGSRRDFAPVPPTTSAVKPRGVQARKLFLQRRSAVAFDGRSTLPLADFAAMLARLRAGSIMRTVFPWVPQVHLAIFVHRVDGLAPGIYAFVRDPAVAAEWRVSLRPQFLWEPYRDGAGTLRDGELYFLLPFDMAWPATRVSCDQDIAGDGFFSLAMMGRVGAVRTYGEWFYRRLFWEAGGIGQLLYLEAEAVGARGTGIGCFYDDAVHELLGLRSSELRTGGGEFDAADAEWQSLYHFAMGRPIEDTRLTTDPGYEWERRDGGSIDVSERVL